MIICLWISVWSKSSAIWSREGQRVLVRNWELKGDVRTVVFSAANPVVGNTVYVYYGAADRFIGLATCALDELLAWVK